MKIYVTECLYHVLMSKIINISVSISLNISIADTLPARSHFTSLSLSDKRLALRYSIRANAKGTNVNLEPKLDKYQNYALAPHGANSFLHGSSASYSIIIAGGTTTFTGSIFNNFEAFCKYLRFLFNSST